MTPQHLFSLTGKTALVTGGATGIGRMAAHGLMAAGANVLIASRTGEMCEATAGELNALGLPGTAQGFAGDVSTEAGVDALVARASVRRCPCRSAREENSTGGGSLGLPSSLSTDDHIARGLREIARNLRWSATVVL